MKFIYWTPRILSILFIAFLAMFSLDIFEPGRSFWEIIVGLFMHNIPVFILIAVLIISWKKEIVGGVVFILAGLLYIFFDLHRSRDISILFLESLIIAGPAFLIGILFLIGWSNKNK
jgi:hypothetical protein